MKDWPPQLWAFFVALVGAVSGWAGKKSNNRADAAAVLTDGALKIVQELQEELGNLRLRMGGMEQTAHRRYAALETEQRLEREWCDMRINQLVQSLHAEGIEVPPPPPRPNLYRELDPN